MFCRVLLTVDGHAYNRNLCPSFSPHIYNLRATTHNLPATVYVYKTDLETEELPTQSHTVDILVSAAGLLSRHVQMYTNTVANDF